MASAALFRTRPLLALYTVRPNHPPFPPHIAIASSTFQARALPQLVTSINHRLPPTFAFTTLHFTSPAPFFFVSSSFLGGKPFECETFPLPAAVQNGRPAIKWHRAAAGTRQVRLHVRGRQESDDAVRCAAESNRALYRMLFQTRHRHNTSRETSIANRTVTQIGGRAWRQDRYATHAQEARCVLQSRWR